jgi:uncharacterized membrane protein YccC
VQQQRRQLASQERELTRQETFANEELQRIAERLESLNDDVAATEADRFMAEDAHKKESRRETLETEYFERSPEFLVTQIPKLHTFLRKFCHSLLPRHRGDV